MGSLYYSNGSVILSCDVIVIVRKNWRRNGLVNKLDKTLTNSSDPLPGPT